MAKSEYIYVSKLDAAKRELEHAIRLFFNDGDFVVMHLISNAALEILSGLGKKSGIKSFKKDLHDTVNAAFNAKKKKEVLRKLNNSYNFIKHANSDPSEQLKFYPESNPFTIFDAVIVYQKLTGEKTGMMESFRIWFSLKYPETLLDGENFINENGLDTIDLNNKSLFLKLADDIESKRIKPNK